MTYVAKIVFIWKTLREIPVSGPLREASGGRGGVTCRDPGVLPLVLCPCRWDGQQTEGLPGLPAVSAAERGALGPGGESRGDTGGGARVCRALQQLRAPVSQWRAMSGERPRHDLRLHLLRV